MAASLRTVVLLTVCLIVILVFCVQESDGRRGGSRGYRSRYRSYRSYRSYRANTRVRVRQRVRIRRGSSGFSSSTWKVAVAAGAIYGGAHYMRSSYYHRFPNRMPPICTNNYEIAPNGRVYGHFICPRETEPANYTWCCGQSSHEFCCDEYYYGRPSRSSGGLSVIGIIGLIVGLIIIIVIVVICIKKRRNAGVVLSKGTPSGPSTKETEPHLTVPLTTTDDQPGGVKANYTAAPNQAPGPGAYPAPVGPYPAAPPGPYPGAYPPPSGPYPPPAGPYPPPAGPYPPPPAGYPDGSMPYPGGPMPGAVPPGAPPPYSADGMQPPPPLGFVQPPPSAPYPQQ